MTNVCRNHRKLLGLASLMASTALVSLFSILVIVRPRTVPALVH